MADCFLFIFPEMRHSLFHLSVLVYHSLIRRLSYQISSKSSSKRIKEAKEQDIVNHCLDQAERPVERVLCVNCNTMLTSLRFTQHLEKCMKSEGAAGK